MELKSTTQLANPALTKLQLKMAIKGKLEQIVESGDTFRDRFIEKHPTTAKYYLMAGLPYSAVATGSLTAAAGLTMPSDPITGMV